MSPIDPQIYLGTIRGTPFAKHLEEAAKAGDIVVVTVAPPWVTLDYRLDLAMRAVAAGTCTVASCPTPACCILVFPDPQRPEAWGPEPQPISGLYWHTPHYCLRCWHEQLDSSGRLLSLCVDLDREGATRILSYKHDGTVQ